MPSGVCGTPSYTPRTRDVESRRQWEQEQAAKELGDPSSLAYWNKARADYDRETREYEEWKRRRDENGNRRYREAVEAEERVVASRTFDILLSGLFDQHGATEAEQQRVRSIMERNHATCLQNIAMWEYVLLRLRGELAGEATETSADWRDILRRKK